MNKKTEMLMKIRIKTIEGFEWNHSLIEEAEKTLGSGQQRVNRGEFAIERAKLFLKEKRYAEAINEVVGALNENPCAFDLRLQFEGTLNKVHSLLYEILVSGADDRLAMATYEAIGEVGEVSLYHAAFMIGVYERLNQPIKARRIKEALRVIAPAFYELIETGGKIG